MQTFTDTEGQPYPVSDAMPILDPEGWTHDDSRRTLSRWKAGLELTERERQWITVRNNRGIMQRIVTFLAGRPYTEIGPTLDCVHGQTWEPDTCGCRVAEVFNNYDEPSARDAKAHRSIKKCQHHQAINDHKNLHAELRAENGHKNKSVHAVAEALGLDVSEVAWSHDGQRTLVIKHAKLKGQDKVKAQAALTDKVGGNRSVRLEE